MRVLFIEVPSREANETPPFGILYAAGAVLRCGHEAKIIDYSNEKFSYSSLTEAINEYKPDLIGLGGITSSYRNLKEYTAFIKERYPKLAIIAGGVISSISELLLTRARVDMVVHCEAETVILPLMRYYQGELPVEEVPGVSYLKDGVVARGADSPQVRSLDDIPLPPYELLDMKKYLYPAKKWIDQYFRDDYEEKAEITRRLGETPFMFPVMSARGCTHRCIFCYRHLKGIRQHSVSYVIEHIKHLMNKYNVGFFQFCDELTTVNKKWIADFCDTLENEKLNINFIVLSARVDTVDEGMLARLKKVGCVMVNCGYESGSDPILKEIKKGVTRDQNISAALLIKKLGMKNVPEMMIGFPGENDETIGDTIEFLNIIGQYPVSVNYVLPFPKTPLWDYCVEKGIIKDAEDFILNYKDAYHFQVNLTNFPDENVRSWMDRLKYETTRARLLKNKFYKDFIKLELRRKVFKKKVWDGMSRIKKRVLQHV